MTASWQPLPPPPPPSPTGKPWYQRWWTLVLLGIAILVAAEVLSTDEGPPETEVASEQIVAEPAPEPEPEPEPEPRQEPAPEPELEHDWPSEEAYSLDMLDSLGAIMEVLGTVSDASNQWPNISNAELATIATEGQLIINDHQDRFRGTTPPTTWQRAHDLSLESWDLLDESLGLFARGMRMEDPVMIGEAAHLMEQGALMMERATDATPY